MVSAEFLLTKIIDKMKQLTYKLKSGRMDVLEVPIPDLKSGMVLVRNLLCMRIGLVNGNNNC